VIESLRLSYELECSVGHAFGIWTTRFATWWPKGHSASGDPDTHVVLEPRLGGRIFERTPSGLEIDWGEITVWSPPSRLSYRWHLGRDGSEATDVELSFVDLGDGRTRLDIVQTGWERLGPQGRAWRDCQPQRLGFGDPRICRDRDESWSPTVGVTPPLVGVSRPGEAACRIVAVRVHGWEHRSASRALATT